VIFPRPSTRLACRWWTNSAGRSIIPRKLH